MPSSAVLYGIAAVWGLITVVNIGLLSLTPTAKITMAIPACELGKYLARGPDGTAERLQSTLDAALADDERTESILRERTRFPDDFLDARRTRDVHITPDIALAHGLVDGIAEFALPKGNQIIQI